MRHRKHSILINSELSRLWYQLLL